MTGEKKLDNAEPRSLGADEGVQNVSLLRQESRNYAVVLRHVV